MGSHGVWIAVVKTVGQGRVTPTTGRRLVSPESLLVTTDKGRPKTTRKTGFVVRWGEV